MENETNSVASDEKILESSVQEVVTSLPIELQNFIKGSERDEVTLRLMKRHNLHADQAVRFQKAFLFMLMGIFSPEQFSQDLTDIGIAPETVRALAADVNEEVFKPLRAKEEQASSLSTAGPATPKLSVPTPVQAPVVVLPTPPLQLAPQSKKTAFLESFTPTSPLPKQAPLLTDIPHAESAQGMLPPPPHPEALPVGIPSATQPIAPPPLPTARTEETKPFIAPQRVASPLPDPAPHASVVSRPPPQPAQEIELTGATIRTMALDMQAVSEHKVPEAMQYVGHAPIPPHIDTIVPRPPGAPASSVVPVFLDTVVQGFSPQPMAQPVAQALIKEYGSDPYRETF